MNIYVSCLLGLLVGGVIGGLGVAFLQQIRMGKIPPVIGLGPIKLDLSGLAPKDQMDITAKDWSDMTTLVEGGGTISSGCLAMIGAAMIFTGFVLPWITCNIPFLLSGSISGFGMLVQLVTGILLSILGVGAAANEIGIAALGGALVIILILVAVVLLIIPIMGLRIGRAGLSLIQSLESSNAWRKEVARILTRAAIIGLIPLLFFITGANIRVSGLLNLLGVSITSADYGLWVTIGGFAVAIIAGIAISTTAAYGEQLARKPEILSSQIVTGKPAVVTQIELTDEENKLLLLIAGGSDNIDIANNLNISPVHASLITTNLLEKFGVKTNKELIDQAKLKGYI
jgi:DNA-binding CsgD family transcriptional regulator